MNYVNGSSTITANQFRLDILDVKDAPRMGRRKCQQNQRNNRN